MASALQFYWKHGKSELALDNEDMLDDLLEDLYTSEVLGLGLNFRGLNTALDTDKTTTSLTFVVMTVSGFQFTPTKANFRATVSNLTLQNSGANQTEAEVRFNGVAGTQNARANNTGAGARPMKASAVFLNVGIGVQHPLEVYWRVSGGTGTALNNTWLVWEVEEWDNP